MYVSHHLADHYNNGKSFSVFMLNNNALLQTRKKRRKNKVTKWTNIKQIHIIMFIYFSDGAWGFLCVRTLPNYVYYSSILYNKLINMRCSENSCIFFVCKGNSSTKLSIPI